MNRDAPDGGWPADQLMVMKACPLCGSTRRETLYTNLRDELTGAAPGFWSMYRCSDCGGGWLDPRPTDESLHRAYVNYITHTQNVGLDGDAPLSALRRMVSGLLNDYRNQRFGSARSPSFLGGRFLVPLLPSLKAQINTVYRHLPRNVPPQGRLLDFGFGTGTFLELAQSLGWRAEGIDFDQVSISAARQRGLKVHATAEFDYDAHAGVFDYITASHVIEHVGDPLKLLKRFYRMMRPGGVLWIETPNLDSDGHRRFGRHWRELDPPRHLVVFTSSRLRAALLDCGFCELRPQWHGLCVFDIFAASHNARKGRRIWNDTANFSLSLGALLAESVQMFAVERRELATFTAVKPSDA